ncbi:hypothetical protein PPL_03854 [Heterostelium album PN500]|uniref:AMP-dependent synthetase/ligase domain-containing protein n=1 Tax=Heterostelium pallidum (strain ATCC 26659 / Pp 5 / PN500) TaxID=670386 RepID=D3B6U6_HETP5|nr:hypothetical protein PPL_03854 [Heterostelium album PN500]EFA83066.1 hypothetical protein PPL_03854 [Heterostelium album PN500]|eukprot:XP_020435183.1 hypothetical protein PPL_03854 [Heterostelium album PN500]
MFNNKDTINLSCLHNTIQSWADDDQSGFLTHFDKEKDTFITYTRCQFKEKYQRFRDIFRKEKLDYIVLVMDQNIDSFAIVISLLSIGCTVSLTAEDPIDDLQDLVDKVKPIHILVPSQVIWNGPFSENILMKNPEFTILKTSYNENRVKSEGIMESTFALQTTGSTYIYSKIVFRKVIGCITEVYGIMEILNCSSTDVCYINTGLAHGYGFIVSLVSLLSGSHLVLLRYNEIKFPIQAPSPTILFGLNGTYEWLSVNQPKNFNFKSIRHAFGCCAVLPKKLSEIVYEKYGFHVGQFYGTTEMGGCSFDIRQGVEKYPSTRIFVLPHYKWKLVPHPIGGSELWVKSDVSVGLGYMLKDPNLPISKITDDEGWYHTGDRVELIDDMDEPGKLILSYVSRFKIGKTSKGDFDLNKLEEQILGSLGLDILERIVIVEPGFYLIALIKNTCKLDNLNFISLENTIIQHIQEHYSYLNPIKISIVDKLPLHGSGKLLYRDVLELFGDLQAAIDKDSSNI